MKNILAFSFILFQTLYSGDINGEKIKISGTITGYPDNTRVILKNLDTQKGIDTTYILNNQFNFTILKSDPVPHGIFIGENYDYLFFWLEDVDINITGTKEKLRDAGSLRISGGKVQSQTNDFSLITRPLSLRFDSINAVSRKAYEENDLVKAKPLEQQLDDIIHERIVLGAKYVKENPDNLLSAFALVGFIPGLPKSEVKSLYENLSPEIKKSRYAKAISNSDFWASGCAPCRIENKNLLINYRKYKSKGFEIISVTSDKNKDNWRSASKEDSIIWPSLFDDAHVGIRYNVKFIPSSFLIDPGGRIIATDLRAEKLEEKLKELFGE
jgi:thiol-disulfide isomerase/thioredoxin